MSDPSFAVKDPRQIVADALEAYRVATITASKPDGVRLAPADPRRLHLQALLAIVSQLRGLVDYAGKQNLVDYVGEEWIEALAALWGLERIPAGPSKTTIRWVPASVGGVISIPGGVRVSDGTSSWAVDADTVSDSGADYLDTPATCTASGSASNGVAIGQIAIIVDRDRVPGIASAANTTETISGREVETLEELRARLRLAPESTAIAGPRAAYQAIALAASANVADAVALAQADAAEMAGSAPGSGEVQIKAIEGTRDASGALVSVIPDPSSGLLAAVLAACSAETVRPLTDYVTISAPRFVDVDLDVTYWIARSRSRQSTAIQAAVVAAFEAFQLWQQSAIGRDVNPDRLRAALVDAGAKRTTIASPAFAALKRDECARIRYVSIAFAGVEDD